MTSESAAAKELRGIIARCFLPNSVEKIIEHAATLLERTQPSSAVEQEPVLKALGNCYTMARREIHRLKRLPGSDAVALERWEHVKRFCEETGLKSSILRASFPTELTDGEPEKAREGK